MFAFLRKSLVTKAVATFAALLIAGVAAAVTARQAGITQIGLNASIALTWAVAALIFALFLWNVVGPLNRLVRQVRHLLSGQDYRRVPPVTSDEVGIVTHFFNEITADLEKVAYDLKERKRMSSELDIAASIQRDVLPKVAPAIPGFDVVAKNRAAAEIGGDLFDFLPSPDERNVYFYIGDVTGHGVPAGLVMMMASILIRAMVSQNPASGRDVIVSTNELLMPRISSRLFMTCVMLRWNQEEESLHYTGAGHEHILVYRQSTGQVEAIRSGGIALGMIPDVSKITSEAQIPLDVGDAVVLYSDGITEAKNQTGTMYTLDRLVESLRRNGVQPTAASLFDHLTKDFANFVGPYVQVDDISMIVVKYVGKEAPVAEIQLSVENEAVSPRPGAKVWNWTD